jgi:hypothetical protein
MNSSLLDFFETSKGETVVTKLQTHFEQVPLESIRGISEGERQPKNDSPKKAGFASQQGYGPIQNTKPAFPPFDIFRTEEEGNLLWRGTAASFDEAKALVHEWAKSTPGEYVIVSLATGSRIVLIV